MEAMQFDVTVKFVRLAPATRRLSPAPGAIPANFAGLKPNSSANSTISAAGLCREGNQAARSTSKFITQFSPTLISAHGEPKAAAPA